MSKTLIVCHKAHLLREITTWTFASRTILSFCRILVPDYGFMHLELIPMLVGFFTYKIATFTQAIEEAVKVASGGEV